MELVQRKRYAAALMTLCCIEKELYVAVFEELKTKKPLGKFKGMRSIPCESDELEDATPRDAFHRVIDEEYGLSPNQLSYVSNPIPINGFFHGWPVYVGLSIISERVCFSPNDSDDIRFDGWIPLRVFIQMAAKGDLTRPETYDIITAALNLLEDRGHELLEGAKA